MSKHSFYFSHDGNARNDDKIIAVRMKYGAEGYAVYFMILERLLECTNYMSVKDYNIIAFDLRVSAGTVKSIIEDYGLFQISEDGKSFWSEKFKERMLPLDNLKEQRRVAGLKSAESRAKNQQKTSLLPENSTVVQRSLTQNPTKERRGKERKEKEKKGEEINTVDSLSPLVAAPVKKDFKTPVVGFPSKEKNEPPPSSAAPPSLVRDENGIATCQELRKNLLEYQEKSPELYKNSLYREFLKYWSEPNDRNVPRWKTEKTKKGGRFDIAGRLSTWYSKSIENGSSNRNSTTNRGSNTGLRPMGQVEPNYRGGKDLPDIEL